MTSPSEVAIVRDTGKYLRRHILPKFRGKRGILSKRVVEEALGENPPLFLMTRPLRNRRALVTKALDGLLPRWSDTAWILPQEDDP